MKLFGKSYTTVGEGSSDLLLKCRGDIKIQWGNKFIDLVKDGKINTDSKIINRVRNKDSIGNKDGIYVTESQEIYLKSSDNIIDLSGGTSFVSFMGVQETTPEQKYTALQNIGFIYENLNQITDQSLQNGIVYITSLKKLYTIVDGKLSEYSISLSSNQNSQIIIQKNDDSIGAIQIIGEGINNSLAFNSLYIYSNEQDTYFNSLSTIHFIVGNNEVARISKNGLFIDNIQSTGDNNFSISFDGSYSTIISDNLHIRQTATVDSDILASDNSASIATTSWVHSQIPTGSIILFNGDSTIPEGWYICNGENGTPDLSQQFITAGDSQIVYIYKSI